MTGVSLRVADVPAGLERAAALAGQQDRQVVVGVAVAVAVAAAVGDHAVVQQRAVAFRDRLQLAEQVGELLDVEGVDRADLVDLLRVVAVVRQLVVAFGDADDPVLLLAALAGEHEGDDAGHVGLERQHHQVAHQAEVLRQVGRHLLRLDRVLGRLHRRQGLGAGDPQFQLADAGEVLVQLLPIGAAELVVQAPGVFQHGVEHAGPQAVPLEAVGVVGPLGEEALEDEFGVDLVRQRRRRRAPRRSCARRRRSSRCRSCRCRGTRSMPSSSEGSRV